MNDLKTMSVILLFLLSMNLHYSALALDVHPPQVEDLSEATVFFNKLLNTSRNPVILRMAKESLLKIQAGQLDSSLADIAETSKTVTEVKLLPQADNTYVVPVVLNRKYMATFLVDTGASYTVITPQMAESLGVQVTGETPMVPVTTANGTVQAPVVTLKNVSLGGMHVKNVDVVVTPLGDSPQLSGLLGMSFFKGMELSFKQDKLVISR